MLVRVLLAALLLAGCTAPAPVEEPAPPARTPPTVFVEETPPQPAPPAEEPVPAAPADASHTCEGENACQGGKGCDNTVTVSVGKGSCEDGEDGGRDPA